MKPFLLLLFLGFNFNYMMAQSMMIENFDFKNQHFWRIINDGVMGGISTSQMELLPNEKGQFSGFVSLENNGGFASIRRLLINKPTTSFTKVKIRVKGDGKKYKFRMRNSNRFDGMAYSKTFETTSDKWIEINLPIKNFDATFRGRIYSDYPKLVPEDLRQVGFLIADKQEGKFYLEVDWIRVK